MNSALVATLHAMTQTCYALLCLDPSTIDQRMHTSIVPCHVLTQTCYALPCHDTNKRRGTKSEVKTYARGHHDAPRNKAWIQRLSRFPQ